MEIKTYPLKVMTLEEAKEEQFRLVEIIANHFDGNNILQAGDYGLVSEFKRPHFTQKVENIFAEFFKTEGACLVRGSGTGALRLAFMAGMKSGEKILLHKAPIYPTTDVTIKSMGLKVVYADFNDYGEVKKIIKDQKVEFALVQHTRQKLDDKYELGEVIASMRETTDRITIFADDNYAVMRSKKIGVQVGSHISTFSLFKLLGPAGIGCILGDLPFIENVRKQMYSGGSQVQGVEAMDALRMLIFVPVALAIQGEVVADVANQLNNGVIDGVKNAVVTNSQSRVVLVELDKPIAKKIIKESSKYGAVNYPVGSESRFEILPLFYRVSGTFLNDNPDMENFMIRINPFRSGTKLILSILEKSIKAAEEN